MTRATPAFGLGRPATRTLATMLVALLLVLAGCSGAGLSGGDNEDDMPFMDHSDDDEEHEDMAGNVSDAELNATLHQSEHITFEHQSSDGRSVTIQSVTLAEGGYVAIHDARRLDAGLAQSLIGISEPLEGGTYEDLTVELFDVPGYDYGDDPQLTGDPHLVVTIHHPMDEGSFEYVADGADGEGPYLNETGAVHADFVMISTGDEDEDG